MLMILSIACCYSDWQVGGPSWEEKDHGYVTHRGRWLARRDFHCLYADDIPTFYFGARVDLNRYISPEVSFAACVVFICDPAVWWGFELSICFHVGHGIRINTFE